MLRTAARRSFYGFVAEREPAAIAQCAAVLHIPTKKAPTPAPQYLESSEIEAILDQPDRKCLEVPAGTNLQSAASGFKNLGEFVAAAHVSHNLGIPFADLKAKMESGDSLGQAIRTLRPEADFQAAVGKAQAQAREDQGTERRTP